MQSSAITRNTIVIDFLLSLGLAFLPFVLYPKGIELAGDQTVQIVAAEAFAKEGHLRVPLRADDPHPKELTIGSDLRRTLRWFPLGYSLLITIGLKLGLDIASTAILWFFVHRMIFSFFWFQIGRQIGVPFIKVLISILFSIVLYYPSTTTDGFSSALAAALLFIFFRSESKPYIIWWGIPLLFIAIAIRWSAISLVVIWFTLYTVRIILARDCLQKKMFKIILITSTLPLLWYFILSIFCSGSLSPIKPPSITIATNWLLISKGCYYAFIGGWSPVSNILKIIAVGFAFLFTISVIRSIFDTSKDWRSKLALSILIFQVVIILHLILTQILLRGHYYSYNEPAFAVARYYSLVQPGCILILLYSSDFLPLKLAHFIKGTTFLFLTISAFEWIIKNHVTQSALVAGKDSFLRKESIIRLHQEIAATNSIAVLSNLDVEVYTGTNPRTLYPLVFEGLYVPNGGTIVIVSDKSVLSSNHFAKYIARSLPVESTRYCGEYILQTYIVPTGVYLPSSTSKE